ncbi:MAG: AAA family ATPase [Candidatus Alkanophagales archaeon]
MSLWVEKYRPRTLSGIVGQDAAVGVGRRLLKTGNMPNLLLWGPRGVGKFSFARALALELHGDLENFVSLDASNIFEVGKKYLAEERRFRLFYEERASVIDTFKRIVREFTALAPINADFKIIFFGNAEALTLDAQHALRRTMERYSRTCRFVFSTTNPAKIITPLRSRCLMLHFRKLSDEHIESIVRRVASGERLRLSADALRLIKARADGNAFVAISLLQAAAALAPSAAGERYISGDAVRLAIERSYGADAAEVEALLSHALEGEHEALRKKFRSLLDDRGVSCRELLECLRDAVKRRAAEGRMPVEKAARILLKISDVDARLCECLNAEIHVEEALASFSAL